MQCSRVLSHGALSSFPQNGSRGGGEGGEPDLLCFRMSTMVRSLKELSSPMQTTGENTRTVVSTHQRI